MFRKTDPQPSLYLTANLLPPQMLARLELDWPGPFRSTLLPLIDEEMFRPLYHSDNGRPNTPVRLVLGVLLLKEYFDLTDEEALRHLAYDLCWHVALERTLEDAPCCQKTLHNLRVNLMKHDFLKPVFVSLTGQMLEVLGISVEKQRLDSTHILSNIARLNRLGLFCETIRVFLSDVRRVCPAQFAAVPESLRRRYLKDDGGAAAYQDARKEEAPRRLQVCARDLWRLLDRFRPDEAVHALASFGLLERLFSEQCETPAVPSAPEPGDADVADPPVAVALKPPKDVDSSSLQSPHDADVTYSGHKGKGYEVQLSETHGNGDKPEMLTHVELTPACQSDEAAAIPVLQDLRAAGVQPKEMEADTTYGSLDNVRAYAALGTELVAPVPGKAPPPLAAGEHCAAEFQVDVAGDGPVVCPRGQTTTEVLRSETGRIHARFSPEQCAGCPLQDGCPTRRNKDGSRSLVTSRNAYELERRRRHQATEEFRIKYAPRAGIEATNSEAKRAHGLGRPRVRGGKRVRLAVFLKVLACNIKRMVRYLAQQARKVAEAARQAVEAARNAGAHGAKSPGGVMLMDFRSSDRHDRPIEMGLEIGWALVQRQCARVPELRAA